MDRMEADSISDENEQDHDVAAIEAEDLQEEPVDPSGATAPSYYARISRVRLLAPDHERELFKRIAAGDTQAEEVVLSSYLRLVYAQARVLVIPSVALEDLVAAGNLGLLKAIRRYDPNNGARLATYANSYIKEAIFDHLIRNSRIVRIATTKSQRKLFFKLNAVKKSMRLANSQATLSPAEVKKVAGLLNVKESDVVEMERRLSKSDCSLEAQTDDSSGHDDRSSIAQELASEENSPEEVLARLQRRWLSGPGIDAAIAQLDERARRVIRARWVDVQDNGQGPTLAMLGREFGVTAERIRQIEVAALKRLKIALTQYA